MKKLLILLPLLTFLPLPFFADQVACPDGLKFVNLGVSQAEFESTCGQAQKVTSSSDQNSSVGYYVWTYTAVGNNTTGPNAASNPIVQTNTMQVAVVIHNNQIGAIRYLDSATLASSFQCGMRKVFVGNTTDELITACGQPTSKQQLTNVPGHPDQKLPQATILQYQAQAYMPLVSYVFVNDQLQGRREAVGVQLSS